MSGVEKVSYFYDKTKNIDIFSIVKKILAIFTPSLFLLG